MNNLESAKQILNFQIQTGLIVKANPDEIKEIERYFSLCIKRNLNLAVAIDLICDRFQTIVSNKVDCRSLLNHYHII